MPEVDLLTLADAGAFVSREHQAHLDAMGIRDVQVDAAASTCTFTDAQGTRRTVRAHLIGTSSPTDGTWLWAWRNVNGFPQPFVRQSERVRALGERYAVAEFTSASLPLGEALPQTLIDAVKAVTGVTAHRAVPTGNGETRAWLLLDDPSLALPAPTVARAVGVVTSALAGGGATDHRRALTAWAEQRGATLSRVDDDVAELALTDGSLQVRFDGAGRISGLGRRLRSTPGRTPSPAPQPPPIPPEPTPSPAAVDRAPVRADPVAPPRRGLLQRLLGR
ncbi:MAG: hypothetical protein HIU86_01715 [Acidobacteria bacterium]|nr:hypothetical protein [Acidobacteriota bacterium]